MILHPGDFYKQLPREIDYTSALIFLFACSILFSILGSLYITQQKIFFALIYLINAFFMPFIMAFFLYLVTFLLCKDVFTYRTLFGITAYANVTLLFSWIPVLSWIAGIWKFYLIGLGMVKVGNIKGSRAFMAILAAAAMLLILLQLSQPIIRNL